MRNQIFAELKISEAYYFLKKMEEHYYDNPDFGYYYSAFLSAARSITLYLKKQFSSYPSFDKWYSAKQDYMRKDPGLSYLNKARTEDIHEYRTPHLVTQSIKVTFSPSIREQNERRVKNLPYIPQFMTTSDPKLESRYLPHPINSEILEYSKLQLEKLDFIIKEWSEKIQ